MAYPEADKGLASTTQAVQKLSVQQFPMVTYDMVDWDYSYLTIANILPPIGPTWANMENLFRGNLNLPANFKPATQLGVGLGFTLYFNRPIFVNHVFLSYQTTLAIPAPTCQVIHVDGAVEALGLMIVSPLGRGYQPPVINSPIIGITFTNPSPVFVLDLFNIGILLANVMTAGGVPPAGSLNNFYTDEVLDPIPPGLLGVAFVYGFNSIAFIVKNSSPNQIEFSEDAGVTWEKLDAHDQVWFDYKQRIGLTVRDPAGAGGQLYRVWAW